MNKLIDYYVYAKFCWNNIQNDIAMPKLIIQFAIAIITMLGVFHITGYFWLVIIIGILSVVFVTWLGHLKIKYGIVRLEQKLSNDNNDEMQILLKNAKKD